MRDVDDAADRGAVLIEALIALSMVAVFLVVFTASMISSVGAQNTARGNDIASQVAYGELEKAKAASWSRLGFLAADGAPATYSGQTTVITAASTNDAGRLKPSKVITVRGMAVTVTTNITWSGAAPVGGSGAFGTKIVRVDVSYKPIGGKTTVTSTFMASRTPTPSEATPTGISSGAVS